MDLQEIFDETTAHLLQQGETSELWDEWQQGYYCRYRGEGGLKCAVGHWISDARYSEDLEGQRLIDENVQAAMPDWFQDVPRSEFNQMLELLNDLQQCHDQIPVSGWRADFARIAERFSLSTAAIDAPAPPT